MFKNKAILKMRFWNVINLEKFFVEILWNFILDLTSGLVYEQFFLWLHSKFLNPDFKRCLMITRNFTIEFGTKIVLISETKIVTKLFQLGNVFNILQKLSNYFVFKDAGGDLIFKYFIEIYILLLRVNEINDDYQIDYKMERLYPWKQKEIIQINNVFKIIKIFHKKRIILVHGDLHEGNVMISKNGIVKFTDFVNSCFYVEFWGQGEKYIGTKRALRIGMENF